MSSDHEEPDHPEPTETPTNPSTPGNVVRFSSDSGLTPEQERERAKRRIQRLARALDRMVERNADQGDEARGCPTCSDTLFVLFEQVRPDGEKVLRSHPCVDCVGGRTIAEHRLAEAEARRRPAEQGPYYRRRQSTDGLPWRDPGDFEEP